ncbi:hypothetical protein M885DRAFT_80818 [Pelagophyceae sp. CCMP2097]|nr:hypothetical protein M885DRAFT_80818 [Pelagophyceae sp. CCMP2097]
MAIERGRLETPSPGAFPKRRSKAPFRRAGERRNDGIVFALQPARRVCRFCAFDRPVFERVWPRHEADPSKTGLVSRQTRHPLGLTQIEQLEPNTQPLLLRGLPRGVPRRQSETPALLGETAPTLSEVKAAYEKLSDALAKQSSAAGAYTSIGGKARDFGTVRNAKREADIEAAVVALQCVGGGARRFAVWGLLPSPFYLVRRLVDARFPRTDYVTMFLARNVQKAAAAQRESAAALAEAL